MGETINLSLTNISQYVKEGYGKVEINATGIIRDVCQFKYDYAYQAYALFMVKMILILVGILIVNRLLSRFFPFEKKYFGIDDDGFYINYKNIIEYFDYSDLPKIFKKIMYIALGHVEKSYLKDDLKTILLYVFIIRTIFLYFTYFDKYPFLNIRGF